MISLTACSLASAARRADRLRSGHLIPATLNHPSDGSDSISKDILALLCPDWRTIALVLDGTEGYVAYANLLCLEMFKRQYPAHLNGGRLVFSSPDLNKRFYAALVRAVELGSETAVVIERGAQDDTWVSVTIRNTQGFFRDVLVQNLRPDISHMTVIEITKRGNALDPIALAAFAEANSLADAETDLVEAVACGLPLKSIAAARAVAISTIRQRMKTVFSKTNCRRQAELVHLVVSLCPQNPNWNTAEFAHANRAKARRRS